MSKPRALNMTYSSKEGTKLVDDYVRELESQGFPYLLVCQDLPLQKKAWGYKNPDFYIKSETLVPGRIYEVDERWRYTKGQIKYKMKGSEKHYHSSKFRKMGVEEIKQLIREQKIDKLLSDG